MKDRPTRRVLFCTQSAHVWGGLEVWLDEIVPFLRANGWTPVVGLARGRRFNRPEAYRAAHPTFETVELDGRAGTREARVAALRRAIRETRADLVVPVNLTDVYEAVAREKLAGSNVRLLVMLRSITPHGEVEQMRIWREFVDVAVGGNRLRRNLIERWAGITEERLRYIPTGTRRVASASRPASAGPLRLGYVGRLEREEKRATDLVTLADALDARGVAYELVIAGDGPARGELESALGSRARFLGRTPVDQLYEDVFPRLDVLLLFSTSEAGPQVVWQAMQFGVVPVVSQYRGAAAEGILRDGETAMLFPVGDAERAAEAIARLASDRALLASIGEAGRRVIEPEYFLEHAFQRWLEVFGEALTMPIARGASLPALTASGLYERLGLPVSVAYWLRRVSGRAPAPAESGAEWPHQGALSAETFAQIDALMRELDRASPA